MERRRRADGKPQPTLADYAEAVRQAGVADGVPVIDLNAMSLTLHAAVGEEASKDASSSTPRMRFRVGATR